VRYFDPHHSVFEHGGWSDLDGRKCTGPLGPSNDDAEPTRAQADAAALRALLLALVGCENTLDLLLRWASGEITYCELGTALGIDRRTAKARIQQVLADIRTKLTTWPFPNDFTRANFSSAPATTRDAA
jgi:hypothetical protein